MRRSGCPGSDAERTARLAELVGGSGLCVVHHISVAMSVARRAPRARGSHSLPASILHVAAIENMPQAVGRGLARNKRRAVGKRKKG